MISMHPRFAARAALAFGASLLAAVACGDSTDETEPAVRQRGTAGKTGRGSGGANSQKGGTAGAGGRGVAGQGVAGQGVAGTTAGAGGSVCVVSCQNRFCGASDGCDGFCVDCPTKNQVCDAKTRMCVSTAPGCAATCAGKTCGQDDGCGGICNLCPGRGKVCDVASKQCVNAGGCVPSCVGKTCGQDDGCGNKCTTCPAGQSCNTASGACSAQACVGSCEGKTCGSDDGCGKKCTNCADPAATCNAATGACKVVCMPSCTGRTCGDDNGCGAKCGGCPGGNVCDTSTFSCKPPCKAACEGKACGDPDGCGGKCSTCPAGKTCSPTAFACNDCNPACANGCVTSTSGLIGAGVQFCRCAAGEVSKGNGVCEPDPACATGCGDHGACVKASSIIGTFYDCVCETGYVSFSGKCIPEGTFYCRDRDGSIQELGTLRCSLDDTLFEVCRDGNGDGLQEWVPSGNPACPAGNACSLCKDWGCKDGVACPEGTLCVPTIHEQQVNLCFGGTCDCSNCGTCNAGDFQGFQARCGGPSGGPATLACKQPCPGGLGCIPFTVNDGGQTYPGICYPAEGCFSAAP